MSDYQEYSGIEGHQDDIAQATMRKSSCAITKDILKYLNTLSIKYGYNRQLIDSIFEPREYVDNDEFPTDVIDERFPLFLSMVIPHYHKAGVKTDLHYRTVWVGLMSKKKDEESTFIVDIPASAFELLPDVPSVKYLKQDEWREWWDNEKNRITQEFIDEMNKLEKEGE